MRISDGSSDVCSSDLNREAATLLVAVNSVFQILAYSLLGYFYLKLLPGWLGLDQEALDVSLWEIAKSVLIFVGVPLLAGYLSRVSGEARQGVAWYANRILPRSSEESREGKECVGTYKF